MEYKSIWSLSLDNSKEKKLDKSIICDILIIGGGITGLTTAFYLNESNMDVILVERNRVGTGASSKSTGKINYLQDILSKINKTDVSKYLDSQLESIKLIKNIIESNKIECDLKKVNSYLFGNTNKEIKDLKKVEELLRTKNIDYVKGEMPISIDNKKALMVKDTYIFNPGKYINGLKKLVKASIYENTFINKIVDSNDEYIAYTKDYHIKAKKIVLACWYPYFLIPFFFPIKTHLEKSYLGCFPTKNVKDITGINMEKPTKSFRYYEDYFIYLINSHLICNGDNEVNFNELESTFKGKYLWSNMDIITNDYLPYIGKISNNLLIGTGYNTWGNTNGTLSGKILSDILLDKNNDYIELFDPKRKTNLKKIFNNIINGLCSIKGYIKGLMFKKNYVYYWKDKAVYVSSKGKHYAVKRKCPHLKCNLIFNYKEKTWDCPCHGSRFDLNGNCIFGPSNYNIKIDKVKKD